MGSFIRKNSPTTAKGITNEQEQLKVNAAGDLLVALDTNSGATAFQNDNNQNALSTTLTDDSPGDGHGSQGNNLGALISAYNEVNTSFRYLRQSNANGLYVTGPVVRNPSSSILQVVATAGGGDASDAITNAIALLPSTGTSIIEIIKIIVLPADPTYTNFTCSILYIQNMA